MICEQHFSVKKDGTAYCGCFCVNPELIENYEKAIADKEHTWICHHKLEAFYTMEELKDLGKYFDRPPRELIFVETEKDHQYWPHKGQLEGYKKLSKAKMNHIVSDEAKEKIRKNHIGLKASEDVKRKMSEAHKGKHWKLIDGKRVYY